MTTQLGALPHGGRVCGAHERRQPSLSPPAARHVLKHQSVRSTCKWMLLMTPSLVK